VGEEARPAVRLGECGVGVDKLLDDPAGRLIRVYDSQRFWDCYNSTMRVTAPISKHDKVGRTRQLDLFTVQVYEFEIFLFGSMQEPIVRVGTGVERLT
jgi:hypothetical protein